MLFNSYIFIFLFLPLCLAGYYVLQKKCAFAAKVWLTCFSLWFYGYFNRYYLLIMVCSIIGNYFMSGWIVKARAKEKSSGNEKQSRNIMITGVVLNVFVLFYFKYYDFFVENINAAFGSSFPLKHILLPLGISFFTFQQISLLTDTYRGEMEKYEGGYAGGKKNRNGNIPFIDYALFVSFFPQLIAGPIVVHEEMLPQFSRIGKDDRSNQEKLECFVRGVYVFVLGLAKKVLIADTFGIAVDSAYANVNGLNGWESFLTILFYSLQLYFDFSGYCDMAKGIAGMFGMWITDNFHSPYKAGNLVEFWKRWHITLSRFFTKNIYIPLGGNRKGEVRMYCNYLLVFFLSGLWHGAGWNYILWGMLHGVLYVITKWKQRHFPTKPGVMKPIFCLLTFAYVSVAWVYFRADTVAQANVLLGNLFTKPWEFPGSGFAEAFNLGEFWYVLKIFRIDRLPYAQYYLMWLFTIVTCVITFFGKNVNELAKEFKPRIWNGAAAAILFVWCVVSLSGVSTFLYFNF